MNQKNIFSIFSYPYGLVNFFLTGCMVLFLFCLLSNKAYAVKTLILFVPVDDVGLMEILKKYEDSSEDDYKTDNSVCTEYNCTPEVGENIELGEKLLENNLKETIKEIDKKFKQSVVNVMQSGQAVAAIRKIINQKINENDGVNSNNTCIQGIQFVGKGIGAIFITIGLGLNLLILHRDNGKMFTVNNTGPKVWSILGGAAVSISSVVTICSDIKKTCCGLCCSSKGKKNVEKESENKCSLKKVVIFIGRACLALIDCSRDAYSAGSALEAFLVEDMQLHSMIGTVGKIIGIGWNGSVSFCIAFRGTTILLEQVRSIYDNAKGNLVLSKEEQVIQKMFDKYMMNIKNENSLAALEDSFRSVLDNYSIDGCVDAANIAKCVNKISIVQNKDGIISIQQNRNSKWERGREIGLSLIVIGTAIVSGICLSDLFSSETILYDAGKAGIKVVEGMNGTQVIQDMSMASMANSMQNVPPSMGDAMKNISMADMGNIGMYGNMLNMTYKAGMFVNMLNMTYKVCDPMIGGPKLPIGSFLGMGAIWSMGTYVVQGAHVTFLATHFVSQGKEFIIMIFDPEVRKLFFSQPKSIIILRMVGFGMTAAMVSGYVWNLFGAIPAIVAKNALYTCASNTFLNAVATLPYQVSCVVGISSLTACFMVGWDTVAGSAFSWGKSYFYKITKGAMDTSEDEMLLQFNK